MQISRSGGLTAHGTGYKGRGARGMQEDEVFAVLLRKIKLGGTSTEDIQNAVDNYLKDNPVETESADIDFSKYFE